MGRFKDQMNADADKTDEELHSQIASFTTMTPDKINAIAPQRADKEKLAKLLGIVKSSTEENEQIVQLTSNIESLAGTIIKTLRVLA